MGKDISGQVVIVTGASSGIGRETALLFAREQARVALVARREQQLQALEKEIQEIGTEALSLATDVAQRDQVETMVHRVLDRFDRVDILVNNAGSGLFALVEETTPEDMEVILQVNFFGAFYGIRSVLPTLRRHGSGHIINVASIVGKRGIPLYGPTAQASLPWSGSPSRCAWNSKAVGSRSASSARWGPPRSFSTLPKTLWDEN